METGENSKGISIDNYPTRGEHKCINSQRSLKACSLEGVRPEELLYMYSYYKP